MTAKRDVRVTLTLDVGAAGSLALRSLANALKETAQAQEEINRLRGQTGALTGGVRSQAELFRAQGEAAAAPYNAAADYFKTRRESETAVADAKRRLRAETSGFAASQEQAYGNAATFSQLGFQGIASGTARSAQFGAGLEKLGYARAGAAATKLGQYYEVAKFAAEQTGKAYEKFSDPYATSETALRGLVSETPVLKDVQHINDMFSGRTREVRQLGVYEQHLGIDTQAQAQARQFQLNWAVGQQGAEKRAQLAGAARPILMGDVDRTTAAGEREYRERSRLIPVERELVKLRREEGVATEEDRQAQANIGVLTKERNRLTEQQVRLGESIWQNQQEGGSTVDRARMLTEMMDLRNRSTGVNQQLQEATQRGAQTAARAGEARGRVGMGEAQRTEAEAANLEDRAQQAAERARNLGAMNPLERRMQTQLAQQFYESGVSPDQLPQEYHEAARALTPQKYAQTVQAAGAKSEEFGILQKISPTEYPGSPEELFRQTGKARDKAAQEQTGAEARIAQSAAAAGRTIAEPIVDAINRIAEDTKKNVITMMKAQAAGHP